MVLERPDEGDEQQAGGEHEEVKGEADAEEVGGAVAAGAHDHEVGLVAPKNLKSNIKYLSHI